MDNFERLLAGAHFVVCILKLIVFEFVLAKRKVVGGLNVYVTILTTDSGAVRALAVTG